jgi:hypothetical protein
MMQVSLGSLEGIGEIGSPTFIAGGASSFETIISLIIAVMTVVAGIYFLITLIAAAYNWIGSEGDKVKLKSAQDKITQAVVGLVIVIAAYAIVSLLGHALGFSILNPASIVNSMWSTGG